ncbi:hypothetical protein HMPREF2526_08400 [Corynebacterium sp. HMSC070E08]|uniref:hypothetical protein n=1 Tax=Corynebacterium sp. HMSC070E08 TaxID=1715006 RepID=UPI0008A44880|nr:hypothetical protein [Corynebacterium sp. HMSC070E08]OFN78463.1 hypothetical protein HMPREF2526_08400 [Corynebacterium sp. HMSC070E08]
MPRIRSIKPEFWDSPSTARADLAVRLVYIAMWNWADDSGRGTANLKELEAFCFPNDDVAELPRKSRGNSAHSAGSWRSFAEICGEVAEAYGIKFYRVNERPYYVIPNFKEHQSKDFRPKSKYPTEEEGYFFDVTSGNAIGGVDDDNPNAGDSAHSAGNSAPTAGKTSLVTGEQGNRGTGENTCSSKDERVSANTYPEAFEEFWRAVPSEKKTGKKKALTQWRNATKKITNDELINHMRQHVQHHRARNGNCQYMQDPERWLRNERWEDELTLPPQPATTIPGRLSNAETIRQLEARNQQTQPTQPTNIEDWFHQQAIGNWT